MIDNNREAAMAKIAIVVGHSMRDTFCEALGHAYGRGAQSAGHDAQVFVLARMTFDPVLRGGYREAQALEPDLAAARAALFGADHLVLIFPLWCGDMPAILKGFIDRWWFGAHALKLLRRNILGLLGIHPVRSTIYGMIEGVSADTRASWLREVEAMGSQAS
jgi:putative NADPH-quinone reductase